jgi:hypothetical protein
MFAGLLTDTDLESKNELNFIVAMAQHYYGEVDQATIDALFYTYKMVESLDGYSYIFSDRFISLFLSALTFDCMSEMIDSDVSLTREWTNHASKLFGFQATPVRDEAAIELDKQLLYMIGCKPIESPDRCRTSTTTPYTNCKMKWR